MRLLILHPDLIGRVNKEVLFFEATILLIVCLVVATVQLNRINEELSQNDKRNGYE